MVRVGDRSDGSVTWIAGTAVALTTAFPAAAWAGGTHGGQIIPLPGTAVDELARYRMALGFAAVAFALLVGCATRRPKAPGRPITGGGLDLLSVPGVGRFLLWDRFPLLLQIPAVLLLIILIVAGLAVPSSRGGNLASSFTWSVWWPGLALLTILGGRIWCLACPRPAPLVVTGWTVRGMPTAAFSRPLPVAEILSPPGPGGGNLAWNVGTRSPRLGGRRAARVSGACGQRGVPRWGRTEGG
jgi:hypothetical protein